MTREEMLPRFRRDIRNHVMHIFRDDKAYRHILFKAPGTTCYHFELLTWPGYLTICGDCGTYTFRRVSDMFAFFRMDEHDFHYSNGELSINVGYWAEKLQHGNGYRHELFTEWDEDAFNKLVDEYYQSWLEGFDETQHEEPDEVKSTVNMEIADLKKAGDDEFEAVIAVREFCSQYIEIYDFWEGDSCRRPTSGFLWCLYAIVWGIQAYDREKLLTPAINKFLAIRRSTSL